jgi:Arc/MetJ family transcription regulator
VTPGGNGLAHPQVDRVPVLVPPALHPIGPNGHPHREGRPAMLHFMCMKRTNLVLNEILLEEATRLSGERTYSRTVERALQDFVRRARAKQILELAGSGLWEGDLGTVREDRPVDRTKRRGAR